MSMIRNLDAHLFEAVLKVAREECAHGTWDELSPVLQKSWDALREEGSPSWEMVEQKVRDTCQESGYVH